MNTYVALELSTLSENCENREIESNESNYQGKRSLAMNRWIEFLLNFIRESHKKHTEMRVCMHNRYDIVVRYESEICITLIIPFLRSCGGNSLEMQ